MTKSQYDNLMKLCEALESGEYKQCAGYLHSTTNSSYCCLGVAANLIDPEGWSDYGNVMGVQEHVLGCNSEDGSHHPDMRKNHFLSLEALNMFGLTPGDQETLSGMNDRHNSFEVISQYIRENIASRYKEETC